MRQTSLEAYDRLKSSGKINVMEQSVLDIMTYGFQGMPVTSTEIMQYYGITDPNHIRPRISDLQRKGVVEAVGRQGKETLWRVIK